MSVITVLFRREGHIKTSSETKCNHSHVETKDIARKTKRESGGITERGRKEVEKKSMEVENSSAHSIVI